ncbi:DUF2252 family protein [Rhizobium lentis]|uniref:Uncharacterized protein (DUF2252 family) n=1 Tax=Rhizobium lentis TaxID=1138194 RepID=A0A7W8UKD6_9HYPH|nr:DUF2252 family protein [Rhizobium lentis]MBB4573108.1 uncharacterized protein (DUF2252 family) [Rhizobium lentis]MBB5549037.1 uncharacterized protein (DUF2252 family) [Rhizobium lentis]MBB5559570.1 uncharacterized protein (DUF2252 family) [Rhizobium lentis]MBB5566546.1 uncharacterized protein (DUF2252 family) [Rhizobium lentis]
MTTISQSVRNFETWLAGELGGDLVEDDLKEKHEKMRSDDFVFLRATYWRWCEIILDICPELGRAPEVLAIGDMHLENFGTWRDSEGRLVWGVNDFDDAAVMPYALHLVRLAASAILARNGNGPSARMIGELILGGYCRGLENPLPVILERDHKWLRKALMLPNSERREFWEKYKTLPPGKTKAPAAYIEALSEALPSGSGAFTAKPRSAGTGSLGRPRFVAYAEWQGGPVLREAKALVPSAWSLHHRPLDVAIRAGEIAAGRARSADPHYRVCGRILVRRLSPNSRKIEIEKHPEILLSPTMLELMGFEIANCHSDDAAAAAAILQDLKARGPEWLHEAARAAASSVSAEQKAYARTR